MELIEYYEKFIEFLNLLLDVKNKPNLVVVKNKKLIFNEKNVNIKCIDTNAKFLTDTNTIYINLDKHNIENHDEIFSITHEYRHFFQFQQILNINKSLEDKNVVSSWKFNFDNYINFGNEDFYKQDIEIDANAFTVFIIQKLFQRPCYINSKFDSNKVEKYFDLYKKKYTDKKIQDMLGTIKLNVYDLFKIKC